MDAKMKYVLKTLLLLISVAILSSCKKESVEPQLLVSKEAISIPSEGGSGTFAITSNDSWTIADNASAWLPLSQRNGNSGSTVVNFTIGKNPLRTVRSTVLVIKADNGQARRLILSQEASIYPSYNTSPLSSDARGMNSNAVELAAKIKVGWNLGNTLEATGSETAWNPTKTTKALIDLVKAQGFNAVRIPCSFNQYLVNAETAQIKPDWLRRVKEVIQYCTDNDMYVILNIHLDGGWLQDNITPEKQIETNAKQRAFWEQIATYMRGFDEHLMFASANEPSANTATSVAILQSYHQTFINAVRSTGGRNSHRVLVVQGPATNIDLTTDLMTSLPQDSIANKLMMEVHYYEPWQFAGLTSDVDWGKVFYYWGRDNHSTTDLGRNATWGEESFVDQEFKKMKTSFIDKGIPVVLGEYGVIRRTDKLSGDALMLHLKSRAYYIKYVTRQAIANGLLPFYWDEGSISNNGFGIIDRPNNKVGDQQALDALMEGVNE
jgi:endoglucanase